MQLLNYKAHTPACQARLEELWVRYCQTGLKWGKSYPPPNLMSQSYLSAQFTPTAQSSRKREHSPSSETTPTPNRYKKMHFISEEDVRVAEAKAVAVKKAKYRANCKLSRPITFIDTEVIEISD